MNQIMPVFDDSQDTGDPQAVWTIVAVTDLAAHLVTPPPKKFEGLENSEENP